MQSLYWGEQYVWEQRLQGCFHPRIKPQINVYPFPLEEVLYQLLQHAKLEEPADSLHSLEHQWTQYRNEHPEFNTTVDKLIEEGWIDSFLGRCSLVNRVRPEQTNTVEPGELQEILKFLTWLSERFDADRSALYLDDWSEQLACMRKIFPEIPDIDWFVKHHILHEDGCHFCTMPYRKDQGSFFRAFARLWYQMETPEQQEQWVEIASQLGATAELVDYVPHEEWRVLIALLAKRTLQGNVPGAYEEGNRISRNYMFETGKFQLDISYENQLSEKDCVHNLTRAQREHWETSSYFWHRNSIRCFELAAVIDNIPLVPDEVRIDVLMRLKQLHELGLLYLMQPFSAVTTVQMLGYPETQFIALHTLVLLHQGQYRNGNTTAGDCILSWISYAVNKRICQTPEPIKNLLAYLAEFAYRGSEYNQPEKALLSAVLRQLSKVCMSRTDFLRSLTAQLIQSTEEASGLTWCRLVQLLGEWTQLLSETIPKEQHFSSELLLLLYEKMSAYLHRILQTPFNRDAAFISPMLLEKSFWVELYTLAGSRDRAWMREPVLSWYADKTVTSDDRFNARYQFRIGLSLLTTLAQAYETDKTVMNSFGSFLGYVLNAENHILSTEYVWSQREYPELIRAISFLRTDRVIMSQLWGKIEDFRLDELVVLIQFAEDDALRKKLLGLLERKVHESQEVEQFGSLRLMQYVLEQKIEALYDTCEKYLQACLDRIENKPLSDQCSRMQSYLWLLRGDYESLFQKGHRYMQAVAYLEEAGHQNLDLAIQLWKQIAEDGDTQSGHLNWLLSYLRKLAKTPEECVAIRNELYQEIEKLRNKIETNYFASWDESAKLGYAERIVYFEVLCGKDEDEAIQKTAEELQLSIEMLLSTVKSEANDDSDEEKLPVPYPSMIPFSTDQITCALQQFRSLSLKRKAECYFGSRGISVQKDPDTTLILFEVFRTLYHLSNYGDKLVTEGTLNEDRCTQLFRELFNLNGAEWWQVISNDQQQSGSTGNVLKSGVPASAEVDLLIKVDGYTYMILEALVLDHIDRTQVKEHIGKLIGNNITNKPMVLLVYGSSRQHVTLCSNLKKYLRTEFSKPAEELGIKIEPFIEFEQSRFYCEEYNSAFRGLTRDALVTRVCHNGEQDIPLVVLCADIAKRGHTEISKKARSKSTK